MPSRISGILVDHNRRPVSKATLLLKGKIVAKSETDGSFSVNLPKAESPVAITFSAEGYVSNTRIYDSRTGGGNVVVIWPVAYRVKFDASRDLDIELDASRIQIPANALVRDGGKRVDQPIELRFTLFDVTSPFQRAAAPGDFSAQLPDGKIQRLNSYGIFDLDLRDQKGQVALREGAEINLAIAVPPKLVERPPKQVGFYDFDRLPGMWIPVGSFNFVPRTLTYNGTIKRSGLAHNLDNPQETTCITVQVINLYTGSGVPAFLVTAQGAQYSSSGSTDVNGFVCLLVETNSTFAVTAQGVLAGVFMATPHPTNFTSPNFNSGQPDCGDPIKCPFLGTVAVDYTTGQLTV